MTSRQGWADLYAFEVDRIGGTPLFRQIYAEMRSAILQRALRPGTKLPSTRELARRLGVSRNAVVAAYEQLLVEGYVSGKIGAGTYIAADFPEPFAGAPKRNKSRPPGKARAPLLRSPEALDVTSEDDDRPFNLGRTLIDSRTAAVWRKLTARSLRSFDPRHFGYSDPRGVAELRSQVCDYLRAARGVRCEPRQVVVTAGTQQAVDLVIRVLDGKEKHVWIEDPGYPLTRQALVAAGATVHPVPVDGNGIDVEQGTRLAPQAGAVFVTPSHQFPTGVQLSMPRRLELLAWARDAGAWVVEDDYASEFRYGGRPLASLQGLDEHERVIYIGTLNKALFPGLRLGYAVLPHALVRSFVTARYLVDRQPSTLIQSVVAEFMSGGHFASHLRRTRAAYREQRDALVTALRRRVGEHLSTEPPDQGMHLVAYDRRGLCDVTIERAARAQGVVVRAMSRMYVAAPARSALMFGFSGYPPQTMGPAVARFARVFDRQQPAAPFTLYG
jgi:GntR family transcriptional regulator/MocR family aminotransferase